MFSKSLKVISTSRNLRKIIRDRKSNIFNGCCSLTSVAGEDDIYDVCIVGGGIIGCATAMQLKQKYPNMKMILVEKEEKLGLCKTGDLFDVS